MARDNKTLKTVLITHLSKIDDVAMAIPIVYSVCHANPKVNFILATDKEAEGLFVNRPSNLIVLGIESSRYQGIIDPITLASNLHHRYNFDAMVNLNNNVSTKFMALNLKTKGVTTATIGNIYKKPRKILGGNIKQYATPVHAHYKAVFLKLGLKADSEFNSIFDNIEAPQSDVLPRKENDEKWIAIAPFAKYECRQYPLEQMQLVITEIARWEKHTIFLIASEKHQNEINSIAQRYDNVVAIDNSHLSDTHQMTLLNHCDVMITMDSPYLHIASIVGIPAVSVWGATHPSCGFMGWRQAIKDTVHLDIECQPCSLRGNKKCRFSDYHCLRDISPELIIKKVKTVLER